MRPTHEDYPEDDLYQRVSYPGVPGDMAAYIARPKADKKYPLSSSFTRTADSMPISKTWPQGLRKEVTAVAPNALSAIGAVPGNEDEARQSSRN